MNESMNRQITVIQCRWRDLSVGDVICDDRWKHQRWEEVIKVEHHPEYTEVWWKDPDKEGYKVRTMELVNVQVLGER